MSRINKKFWLNGVIITSVTQTVNVIFEEIIKKSDHQILGNLRESQDLPRLQGKSAPLQVLLDTPVRIPVTADPGHCRSFLAWYFP